MSEEIWFEEVKERFCGRVISSTLRPATAADIDEAATLHLLGRCPHTIIKDEAGWMYDFRSCVTCGAGLGAI